MWRYYNCAVPACDQMKPLRLPTIAQLTYEVRLQCLRAQKLTFNSGLTHPQAMVVDLAYLHPAVGAG